MTEDAKKPLQKPRRLTELIDYSPGSIVSHSIQKSEQGNITYFAFAKGEQLSPHSAPYDAFLQVVDGKSEVMVGNEWYAMQAGQAIVLPANVPHAVKASENMQMLLVMIKAESQR